MTSSLSTTARCGGGGGSLTPTAMASIILFSVSLLVPSAHAFFNYEVEKRVFERVEDFMSGPKVVTSLLERFRKNGAFPNNLDVTDKDAYQTLSYSLLNEYKFDMIYYGTEDGIFVGYNEGVWGTYREPVNSGYDINQPEMLKYYIGCVDRQTGDQNNCTMSKGAKYIQCVNDCELELCKDAVTQLCELSEDKSRCKHEQKWCPQYNITTVETEDAKLGYVPRTYYCHTPTGVFSQEPGEVLESDRDLGNCLYGDDRTLVKRDLMGDYVVCASQNNETCNPFIGGFRSRDYDPRYRTWYIQTKEKQRSNWAEPYPFFSNLDLGITFSQPFYEYDEESRREVFKGVFAIDYTFEDITRFLKESYGTSTTNDDSSSSNDAALSAAANTDETHVVIYEAKEPNYMVATSTGRSAASKVLKADPTQACPDDAKDDNSCDVVRVKMSEVAGRPYDDILRISYNQQVLEEYPRNLVSARMSDEPGSSSYVSQSSFYSSGDELEWIILVISPIEKSDSDALTPENGLFGVVCVIASVGFALCLAMFFSFYCKRKARAVILADWRFTSAFLMGCALLNLSSFTFLGENTDALCMARMWSFHFLFALALSPLFVKVYRMYRLVGTPNRNPAIISNPMAVAMTMPIVIIQVIILTVFTIVDPPVPENIIDVDGTVVTQRVECATETNAFVGTVVGFECALVLIGCILAFVTRNLDKGFGQAKELMFSMYNIAFIGLVIAVISFTMDIDASGQIILNSLGIFCGTVFSSAAFVLPRLMESRKEDPVFARRSGTNSPKGSNANKKSQEKPQQPAKQDSKKGGRRTVRSVNFSENLAQDIAYDDERPVTGWSVVEDDFEDGASGMKRASSIGSIQEDDVWTAPADDKSFANGSTNLSFHSGNLRNNTDKTELEQDGTWRSSDLSDIPSGHSSSPSKVSASPGRPESPREQYKEQSHQASGLSV